MGLMAITVDKLHSTRNHPNAGYNYHMAAKSFRAEADNSPLNLSRAALHFAREIAYPELDIGEYVNKIDQLAAMARVSVKPTHNLSEQAEALADFIFIAQGFRGNVQEYNDPRNSYLNEVLDRRLGIPISLSAVYLALAERLEIPAYGVGLPGHFIIGINTPDGSLYLDPFHGGTRLALQECAQLVHQTTGFTGPFQEDWLQPMSPHAILTRMLNNLRLIYLQNQSWDYALAVVEHLRILQPEMVELVRDQGIIYHRQGAYKQAIEHYSDYLQRSSQAPDAETIRSHLHHAAASLARLN